MPGLKENELFKLISRDKSLEKYLDNQKIKRKIYIKDKLFNIIIQYEKNLLIFLITLFLNSCGYTALYKNNNLNNLYFNFEILETSGDGEINNYILSNLNNYQDTSLTKKIKIKINSTYSKSGISNNKSGKTTAYNLVIMTTFDIKNNEKENKIVLKEKVRINRFDDTFEQQNHEKEIKRDTSKIIVNKFINKVSILK